MGIDDFSSIDEVSEALEAAGYLPSREIATCVFLSDRLEKPILVEGPAGVGKTELALAMARATGRELIRLQCYEGLDEAKALYEWEYGKQLLYTQLIKEKLGETLAGAKDLAEAAELVAQSENVFFSERFLLPRPLLRAITSKTPTLLLLDEIDKADPEFEALLLEVLGDFSVTVPELGTFRAKERPRVVLTSNAARELSEALKRRCLHLHLDFPTAARETAIVRAQVPGIEQALVDALVAFVQRLRELELKKAPSIAETLDWARALVLLGAEQLTPELVGDSLSALLKYEGDATRVREQTRELLARSEP